MGIPHLTATLQPYAERCVLDGARVVIDGPALAYHIIYLCTQSHGPTGPLDQPPPALLGQTALAWLDELGQHGLTV